MHVGVTVTWSLVTSAVNLTHGVVGGGLGSLIRVSSRDMGGKNLETKKRKMGQWLKRSGVSVFFLLRCKRS